MQQATSDVRRDIVQATQILVNEGVMDAFGHVSVRDTSDSGRYLMSRSCAPNLITEANILEFTLESNPVEPTDAQLFAERVIHGEIYKARPDVMAVVHCHPVALLPFCISATPLVPVFIMGASIGPQVPFWDQRDEFGDTTLLVVKHEEGRSLAPRAGPPFGRTDEAAWCNGDREQYPGPRLPGGLCMPQCRSPSGRAWLGPRRWFVRRRDRPCGRSLRQRRRILVADLEFLAATPWLPRRQADEAWRCS